MTYTIPKRVNVPELFYTRFVADESFDTQSSNPRDTLLSKLYAMAPTKRGRGQTRWVTGLTHAEWNALYVFAADGRAHMRQADRETTLRPAICAKVLANRMEAVGVDSPVIYVTKTPTKQQVAKIVTPHIAPTAAPTIPLPPLTVDQLSDADEVSDEELTFFLGDIASS